MSFLGRIAQFLFWLVVLSLAVSLIRRVLVWALRKASGAAPRVAETEASRQLHRDPVCGTHVSEGISIAVRQGNETLHFCSAECRDRYLATARRAANA